MDGTALLSTDQSKHNSHRHWPADLQARIVSESLRPCVTVQEIADRYGIVRTTCLHGAR